MRKRLISLLPLTLGAAIVAALIALPTVFAANSPAKRQSAATPQPIVGFWYIKLTAKGNGASGPPDSTVIDWGLQQFHSDGTEILNSGSGPKMFCLGVWVRGTGPSTYEVNHFPLDYSAGPTTLHIINLREKFTLSRNHNNITGTFTFDVYDAGGSPLAHIIGDVDGHRITMDSSVQNILPPPTP